jgi:hypothetical protein
MWNTFHNLTCKLQLCFAIYVTTLQRNEKRLCNPEWDVQHLTWREGAGWDLPVEVLTILSATLQVLEETDGQWGILAMDLSLSNLCVQSMDFIYTNSIPPIKHPSGCAKAFPASACLCGKLSHVIMLPHH